MEVNNNKEMREALEKLHMNFMCDATLLNDRFSPLFTTINHALAAPPRNCDVGAPEEQEERFNAYCRKIKTCGRCRDCMDGYGAEHERCVIEWGQAPYEAPATQEGDSNGSK